MGSAYTKGIEAAYRAFEEYDWAGLSRARNPYPRGTTLHEDWAAGWDDAWGDIESYYDYDEEEDCEW